jgi:hypothetical protein
MDSETDMDRDRDKDKDRIQTISIGKIILKMCQPRKCTQE